MSYSSLLVHVDVDGEIGGRVRLAAELANHFHSHLIGAASWMARPAWRVSRLIRNQQRRTTKKCAQWT